MLFMNLGEAPPLWSSIYIKSHLAQMTAIRLMFFLKQKGGVSVECIFRQTTLSSNTVKETTPREVSGVGFGALHSGSEDSPPPHPLALLCYLTRTHSNNGCHELMSTYVPVTKYSFYTEFHLILRIISLYKICINAILEMMKRLRLVNKLLWLAKQMGIYAETQK